MKIIFTIDSIIRGGKERQLLILASNLVAKNYDIHIICLKSAKNNYLSQYPSIENKISYLNKRSSIKCIIEIYKTIKNDRCELIISFDNKSAMYCLLISIFSKIRFINASLRHGIRLKKVSHILRSLVLSSSKYVIANSRAGLYANNLIPSKTRFILHNGIETKFNFSVDLNKRKQYFDKFGLPISKNQTVYISVANLIPYKDYYTVFLALRTLAEKINFHYLIIGDGPLRKEYEGLIREYGLQEKITIIGQIENVHEYLAISDYMIHSSRGEGISNAVLEGMFAGLPIIATNVGGIPETIWPDSSVLFEYKNYNQLILILQNIEDYFKGFSRNDPNYLAHLQKFSSEHMVREFETIIHKVMTKYD